MAVGSGVVYKIDTAGRVIVLHRFHLGPTDGQFASSGLFREEDGKLYGATSQGGIFNLGTVYVKAATRSATIIVGPTLEL